MTEFDLIAKLLDVFPSLGSAIGIVVYLEFKSRKYSNGNPGDGSGHIVEALRLVTKETERNGEHLEAIRESQEELVKAQIKHLAICETMNRQGSCLPRN